MKIYMMAPLILALGILLGCGFQEQQAKGFSLPEGNIREGEEVYISMHCNECHSLPGMPQAVWDDIYTPSISLGDEMKETKTYGELVTSVINPSHRIAREHFSSGTIMSEDGNPESLMPTYNDIMTVDQLVDLISFLESKYEIAPYDWSHYKVYYH